MRIALLGVLLVGCTGVRSDHPELSMECADHSECTGKLGVGGVVYTNMEVITRNENVLHVGPEDYHPVIGVAPGMGEIDLLDDGIIVDSAELEVADVSMLRLATSATGFDGPLLDSTYDATYKVPANTALGISLHTEIDGAPSIGTHFYEAWVDGERYDCTYTGHYCTGPVYYDAIPLDPLAAGDHVLKLDSVDGGRNFTFRLAAR